MKKIINTPETLVREMCNGIVMAHSELEFMSKFKVVKKREINTNKVSLISGGGSGHEPAHAGFIGKGMLDVAVCGDVFASPSQIQVYQAIKASVSDKGTLLIIKNYSGDVMNFKNAAALAEEDGIKVDYVKVDDDIAVEDSLYTVGHRGVAGTVMVHKVAGAAAEAGEDLAKVKAVAEKAAANVKSLGFALTSCTVPAKGTPTFELGEDEIEFGVGIHGEPGIRREKVASADELAEKIVAKLLAEMKLDKNSKDEVAVLINGFGATPLQELYLFNNSVRKVLDKTNLKINKDFVGNFMTSIDMAGASISIMKLDSELKDLISRDCDAPGFKVNKNSGAADYAEFDEALVDESQASFQLETSEEYAKVSGDSLSLNNMIYMVDKMSDVIIKNEVPFCELDSHAGDGDFGMSIAKGFKALKVEWKYILENQSQTIGSFLDACSLIIMENCGGASGPIWGSAFRAASKSAGSKTSLTLADFAEMMQKAVEGIQTTGERSFGRGAVVGDKTLIDALVPCADSLSESAKAGAGIIDALKKGADAAVAGAKKTEEIAARMGRAGTVGDRSIGHPDAGAYGLGVIFTEVSNSLK